MVKTSSYPFESNTSDDINYLDLSEIVGYPLEIRIHNLSSQTPLWWQSWSNNELLDEGDFLVSPGGDLEAYLSQTDLEMLPDTIRTLIKAMPLLSFEIMQAALSSKEAEELAISNPLLFILLVHYAKCEQLSIDVFQQLVQSKRSRIAQTLGLAGGSSIVKILARMQFIELRVYDLFLLSHLLKDINNINKLRHIKAPSISALILLDISEEFLWPNLFTMVNSCSTTRQVTSIKRLLRDSIQLGVRAQAFKRIENFEELQALHDRAVVRFNSQDIARHARTLYLKYGDYPSAPLPGNTQIVAISSWSDLLAEGAIMHHCISSYHGLLAQGSHFVYQIYGEHRLTLSIEKRERGWVLGELRGLANTYASKNDQDLVANWLLDVQADVHDASHCSAE